MMRHLMANANGCGKVPPAIRNGARTCATGRRTGYFPNYPECIPDRGGAISFKVRELRTIRN